jgi:selenocysteine lyase/cysteine desulfurase
MVSESSGKVLRSWAATSLFRVVINGSMDQEAQASYCSKAIRLASGNAGHTQLYRSDGCRAIAEEPRPSEMDGKQMTPGGFHSLEYRWALCDAFNWMISMGKENIYRRVHELNRMCKEGLASMPHVTLHTPMSDELSAGIISFEIKGYSTEEAVKELNKRKVVATASPYKTSWVRFTPGIINMERDIEKGLEVVDSMRK